MILLSSSSFRVNFKNVMVMISQEPCDKLQFEDAFRHVRGFRCYSPSGMFSVEGCKLKLQA